MDPLSQNPTAQVTRPDPHLLEHYQLIRGQIEHEDNLIGSRISWFVTSQSFLFSAYAIMASSIQPNSSKSGLDAKHMLLVVIPSLAIVTSVLILLAIWSGFAAMTALRERHARRFPNSDDSLLPPIQGNSCNRRMGMAAPILLPPLFMAVWIFLLVRRLF